MKKLITITLLALIGTVANAQTFSFNASAVSFDKEGVSVYGNKCSTVQAQYIEYFKPTEEQISERWNHHICFSFPTRQPL